MFLMVLFSILLKHLPFIYRKNNILRFYLHLNCFMISDCLIYCDMNNLFSLVRNMLSRMEKVRAAVREEVFDDPLLLVPDSAFGGLKPRRTFVGPRYQGGVSDHLPVVFIVYF